MNKKLLFVEVTLMNRKNYKNKYIFITLANQKY